MKVAAHPLVVAVALGLLAPDALESYTPDTKPSPCIDCDEAKADSEQETAWQPSEAPSAEEFHRVEVAWLKATTAT